MSWKDEERGKWEEAMDAWPVGSEVERKTPYFRGKVRGYALGLDGRLCLLCKGSRDEYFLPVNEAREPDSFVRIINDAMLFAQDMAQWQKEAVVRNLVERCKRVRK